MDSRRLVCDAGEGGEGGEGGGTHLLLYVGAVDEDSCLRGERLPQPFLLMCCCFL